MPQTLIANIKGPVGATGPAGATGATGPTGPASTVAGANSNEWRSGVGPPAETLGNVGDFYVDTATSDIYVKQAASGATITAASPAVADVQAAITSAVNGDTVKIPAGSVTWATGISSSKQITIRAVTPGTVTITHGAAGATLFDLTTGTAFNTHLADIKFLAGTGTGKYLNLGGASTDKPPLVHGCHFDVPDFQLLDAITLGRNGGVFYQNTFESLTAVGAAGSSGSGSGCFSIKFDQFGSPGTTVDWTTASSMGLSDTGGLKNVYIEDNTFNNIYLQAIDCDDNSRVVIRNNTFNNSAIVHHGADTSNHGCRHVEIYDNTFIFTASGVVGPITYPLNLNRWLFNRGGTGLMTANVLPNIDSTTWGNKPEINFTVMNLRRNAGPAACATVYPAPHQIGQSHDGVTGITEPFYIWANTGTGNMTPDLSDFSPNECGAGAPSTSTFIVEGRDMVTTGPAKPGWTRFTYPHPLRVS